MVHPLVYAHFASRCFIPLCMLTLLVDVSSSCVRLFCLPMLDHHVYAYSADRPPSFTCSIRRLTRGVHSSILLLQGKRRGYKSRSIEKAGAKSIEEMGELLAIS